MLCSQMRITETQTQSRCRDEFMLGMHRSDTQDRYRLRSGHFLRIGYRRDETDPNPIFVHILLCYC